MEVDLNYPLLYSINLFGSPFELAQPIVYLNKSNACFYCRQHGHLIHEFPIRRSMPILVQASSGPVSKGGPEFSNVPKMSPVSHTKANQNNLMPFVVGIQSSLVPSNLSPTPFKDSIMS